MDTWNLNRYVKALLRWFWLLALVTVVAAGAGFAASRVMKPVYRASSTILAGEDNTNTQVKIEDYILAQRLATGYAALATRQPVLEAAAKALGLPTGWQTLKDNVLVVPVTNTSLLEIRVSDTDPQRAAALANEIVRQLILQSPTTAELQRLQVRQAFTQSQLDSLQASIQAATEDMTQKQAQLDRETSARAVNDLKDQIKADQTKISDWRTQYGQLLNGIPSKSPSTLTVVEAAVIPARPVSPNVLMNVGLAAALGLLLSGGGVFLMEYLSATKLRSEAEITELLGLPALGTIRRTRDLAGNPAARLILKEPHGPAAEAFRILRTNLRFAWASSEPLMLLVTSPGVGEGKSTVSANLAVSFALAGKRTILVDADLRHPMLHDFFGCPADAEGLATILNDPTVRTEAAGLEAQVEAVLRESGIPHLRLLPASSAQEVNPGELFSLPQATLAFRTLSTLAEVVIVDAPPALPVADASILADQDIGVVLIVESHGTTSRNLRETREILDRGTGRLLGFVLNKAVGATGRSYSYYSKDTKPTQKRRISFLPQLRRA